MTEKKRRGIVRRIGKVSLILIACIGVALLAAHLIWKYSGNGQPKLVIDRDGIQVYTIKTPGDTLLKIHAQRVVRASMDKAVASQLDGSLENCHDWIPDCVSSRLVKPWNPVNRDYTRLWVENFPSPFKPRQFLLHTKFQQKDKSAPVTVEFIAAPDALPADNCCYRLTHMHAVWTLRPIDGKDIKVDLFQDIDVGIPYFLFNSDAPGAVFDAFADLPRLYNESKYDQVSLDRIYNGQPIVAD